MASLEERMDKQKHDVWKWRRDEADNVEIVQAARRVFERNSTEANKRTVREAEKQLTRVRGLTDKAEDKLERLQGQWKKLTDNEKQVDYWRDRTQDLHREVQRQIKIVQRLRREEEADRNAAKAEIELAKSLSSAPVPEALGKDDDAADQLPDEFDPETGTVLGDALTFTSKKDVTEAEKRLLYVKGLWHNAQANLLKARKRVHDDEHPTGGNAAAIVNAAKQCEAHSNSYHYSQSGGWRVGIFPQGEPWGIRSDCSQFVTKCYFHAKCRDPNGMAYQGGYTGTLYNHGQRVSNPRPGDLCLVGYPPGHHVELVIASDGTTIGHGDRYVNRSHISYFNPRQLRRYV